MTGSAWPAQDVEWFNLIFENGRRCRRRGGRHRARPDPGGWREALVARTVSTNWFFSIPKGGVGGKRARWRSGGDPGGWREALLKRYGPCRGQDGSKMGNLARFGQQLGDFCWILGPIFAKSDRLQNPRKTQWKNKFFAVLRTLLEAILAHLGARLDYVGQSCRHLGATVRQDVSQVAKKWALQKPS